MFQEEDSRFEILKNMKLEEKKSQEEIIEFSEVELFQQDLKGKIKNHIIIFAQKESWEYIL